MHIIHVPIDGATVVAKQIHDHEIETHAQTTDVHKVNDDGTTTLVAGPSLVVEASVEAHDELPVEDK